MDGLNGLIEIGSGSRVGHSVIAMRKNDNLLFCESKSSSYFPVNGIKCNSYKKWLKWAKNADLNVVILPLKKSIKEKFDQDKAWSFIDSQLGSPYGY